jgi:hypothetical protein
MLYCDAALMLSVRAHVFVWLIAVGNVQEHWQLVHQGLISCLKKSDANGALALYALARQRCKLRQLYAA